MDFLIDGYNLIFECGLQPASTASDMLEKSRNRLIDEIARYAGIEVAKRTTIVFDAAQRPPLAKTNRYRLKNVLVLYSDEFEDADSLIEHLISRHTTPKKLTVVSSDHRLHKAALRRKSKPIDSEKWYDQLLSGKLVSKTSVVKLPPPVGLDEIDWHHELGIDAVDVSAIEAELTAEQAIESADEPLVKAGDENTAEDDTVIRRGVENPFPEGYGEDLLED